MRESVLFSSLLCLLVWLPSVGCDKNVIAPSKVAAPATTASTTSPLPTGQSALWSLTTTITAVDGPDNCFSQEPRSHLGSSTAWTMAVQRSGDTVNFDYDVHNSPIDDVVETGTVSGLDFSAKSDVEPSSFPNCADGTVLKGTFQGTVSGQFSDDGNHLTGNEQWVYAFSTGTITLHMTWSAERKH